MSNAKYSRMAIRLHWIIAVLILVNIALALTVDYFPEAWVRPVIDTHKSIGITVLGLALLRVLWRMSHQPPAFSASLSKWERVAAHGVHIALYVVMLAIPLSGWLHDSAWKDAATHPMQLFYTVPWPRIGFIQHLDPQTKEAMHTLFGTIHSNLAYGFYGLFALHVLGALKHEWIDRDSALRRMGVGG